MLRLCLLYIVPFLIFIPSLSFQMTLSMFSFYSLYFICILLMYTYYVFLNFAEMQIKYHLSPSLSLSLSLSLRRTRLFNLIKL